jgi:primary-amine oxidase
MPVMAVEYAGFMLKPNGFFAANPAMDLPPDKNAASKTGSGGDGGGGGGSCCE